MTKLSAKELASLLNGRTYGLRVTKEEKQLVKENNLVVVYGASDDLMEFEGAISEEIDCYEGVTVYLDKLGKIVHRSDYKDLDDYTTEYKIPDLTHTKAITAIWNDAGNPCWYYQTDIPHETFDIMEDGELYCIGIVFSMGDVVKEGV